MPPKASAAPWRRSGRITARKSASKSSPSTSENPSAAVPAAATTDLPLESTPKPSQQSDTFDNEMPPDKTLISELIETNKNTGKCTEEPVVKLNSPENHGDNTGKSTEESVVELKSPENRGDSHNGEAEHDDVRAKTVESEPVREHKVAESGKKKVVKKIVKVVKSVNSKISAPSKQSLISELPEANVGTNTEKSTEESLVKLNSPENHGDSNKGEAEHDVGAKTVESESVRELKVDEGGKKKVVKKTVKVVKSVNSKISAPSEQSLISELPEANMGMNTEKSTEEPLVKLNSPENHGDSNKGEAEHNVGAKTVESESVRELKVDEGGKKKVVKKTVRIVKKIVKKKVPKLVSKNSVRNEESVKGSQNEESVDVAKSNSRGSLTSGTEICESCNAVLANEGEDSRKGNLEPMEVEKSASVAKGVLENEGTKECEFNVMKNTLGAPILECKDTAVVENDSVDSLETQTVVHDSEKGCAVVSNGDNTDLGKDKNLGQLGEGGNSEIREEKKESMDTSVRNEGIALSGEMEALERKRRRRTEIFIGGLDKETTECDIRKIFEQVGEVMELRLLMNRETGKNKGFAFLRYASATDAKKAVERFSKVEIHGKECGVSLVEGNDTIYLGNIDKKWKTEDVIHLLKKAGIENIDKVTVMADPNKIEHNRGFAFVELETSKEAQIALNKLQKKDVFGKHMKVKVAWAQPLIEPNEEEILKVKSVYAEYLPSSWNEENVREYFDKFGEIENIALGKDLPSSKRKDFAFVNYVSRESALACIEAFNQEPVNDNGSKVKVKVSLAKPMSSKQNKKATFPTKKEPFEEKKKKNQPILKRHEPHKKGNNTRSYYESNRVDGRSSTTNELLHLLRQQASTRQIHSGFSTGSGVDHQYPLSGSKRPFSAVVDDPYCLDASGVSRVRSESYFPIASQRVLSHSHGPHGTPSFAYHHQLTDHSPGLYGVENFRSFSQTQARGPYGGSSSIYHRY